MAERVALWGRDIDESPADLHDAPVASAGHDPITEPIPVVAGDDAVSEDVEEESNVEPLIVRRTGGAGTTLTFKPAPAPWYRTGRGLVVLIAGIAVAVVLAIVPILLRSPAPGSGAPTNVPPTRTPAPSSSVAPTTNSIAPTLTSQPAPPPPALPPPPPPPQDVPVYTPQYPVQRDGPSEQEKPDIGVTRAPISVSPKPVTPIDPPRTGGGGNNNRTGWGW